MADRWLVCDYGQVLSTAPPDTEWDALRRLAGGRADDEFHRLYWEHRPPYDRGDITAADFWALVHPGGQPSLGQLDELVSVDCAIWLHPHQPSVVAATAAADRGFRLALFSNAPREVGAAIDGLEWLGPFRPRFFSWKLRSVKPEAAAYQAVLTSLGADPADVVFVDDRPANVEAARRVGIDGRLYEGPETFSDL
jgi:putative hydrolase of the HAD superfamily